MRLSSRLAIPLGMAAAASLVMFMAGRLAADSAPADQPMAAGAAPRARAASTDGIWIGRAELAARPTSGTAWTHLLEAAGRPCPWPALGNQEDPANVCVMAKALVFARTGTAPHRADVLESLRTLMGAGPYRGRALALARELPAYVIAADLVELPSADGTLDREFRTWLRMVLRTPTSGGPRTLVQSQEQRPNNWGTHAGAARAAAAAYLRDETELARTASVFKGYLGDRDTYAGFTYGERSWQCDPSHPVGINPPGCMKNGHSLDGVLPDDQRRSGPFTWPPPKQNYVYEALQGALAQAIILDRAGYDAFAWQERALLRAFEWLHREAAFPAKGDDEWEPHVVNFFYRTRFPAAVPARPGKNVGWTDWTHGP
jgi:hypothetical protein